MTPVTISYFNDSNTLLDAAMPEEEKRRIVNLTDYRIKVAVNSYKWALTQYGDKKIAAQFASDSLKPEDEQRFLEVMLALELCGQELL